MISVLGVMDTMKTQTIEQLSGWWVGEMRGRNGMGTDKGYRYLRQIFQIVRNKPEGKEGRRNCTGRSMTSKMLTGFYCY